MKKQRERIDTQKELANAIAKAAGELRDRNLSDRMIHKKFYLKFQRTIWECLGEPKAEMLKTIEELKYGFDI